MWYLRFYWNMIYVFIEILSTFLLKYYLRFYWNMIYVFIEIWSTFLLKYDLRFYWNMIYVFIEILSTFLLKYDLRFYWNIIYVFIEIYHLVGVEESVLSLCVESTGTCFIKKIYALSSSLLQGKHLPFSSSPLRLIIFRLFVILSLTQLYRYTPEIFLFSTATFKYTNPQTNWTRIFSESRFVYFSVIGTDTATSGPV
jgi:hypothetical protein